jgi:hypothetical protein
MHGHMNVKFISSLLYYYVVTYREAHKSLGTRRNTLIEIYWKYITLIEYFKH